MEVKELLRERERESLWLDEAFALFHCAVVKRSSAYFILALCLRLPTENLTCLYPCRFANQNKYSDENWKFRIIKRVKKFNSNEERIWRKKKKTIWVNECNHVETWNSLSVSYFRPQLIEPQIWRSVAILIVIESLSFILENTRWRVLLLVKKIQSDWSFINGKDMRLQENVCMCATACVCCTNFENHLSLSVRIDGEIR